MGGENSRRENVCVCWKESLGICWITCGFWIWKWKKKDMQLHTHLHKSPILRLICVCSSSGPESRERPGVLRAHHQAPHRAPSACEQSMSPSIFSFFCLFSSALSQLPSLSWPLSLAFFFPRLPSFLSLPLPSSLKMKKKKKTFPRQTEDRIGVHHGSSDRQTAGQSPGTWLCPQHWSSSPVSLGGHHINLMAFFALFMGMFLCKSKSTSQTRENKEAPDNGIPLFTAAAGCTKRLPWWTARSRERLLWHAENTQNLLRFVSEQKSMKE